jgi:hypothetical protein
VKAREKLKSAFRGFARGPTPNRQKAGFTAGKLGEVYETLGHPAKAVKNYTFAIDVLSDFSGSSGLARTHLLHYR